MFPLFIEYNHLLSECSFDIGFDALDYSNATPKITKHEVCAASQINNLKAGGN